MAARFALLMLGANSARFDTAESRCFLIRHARMLNMVGVRYCGVAQRFHNRSGETGMMETMAKKKKKKTNAPTVSTGLDYMVSKHPKGKAHIWDGTDSLCRMASTGGLDQNLYDITNRTTKPICSMCKRREPKYVEQLLDEQIAMDMTGIL